MSIKREADGYECFSYCTSNAPLTCKFHTLAVRVMCLHFIITESKLQKAQCAGDLSANGSLPVFFHCQGPPASCMGQVLCSHDSRPPETSHTGMIKR